MAETVNTGESSASRPTISIPPRPDIFSIGSVPGPVYSPGPITLMSSLFSDSCSSFSQLLAGAIASPLANKDPNLNSGPGKIGPESGSGSKQSQMSLLVAHPQLFMPSPRFSPSGLINSPGFVSPLQSPFGMSHQQALAHVTAQAALNQSYKQMQAENVHSSSAEATGKQCQATDVPSDTQSLKLETSGVSQTDNKVGSGSGAVEKPVSDGYNWRKYGQKLVKGSECPRSYYRCTHLNCTVKKKVERSSDGRVVEITYKGKHNHEIPESNKRKQDDCDQECREQKDENLISKPQSGYTEKNKSNKRKKNDCDQEVLTKPISEQLSMPCKRDEREESAIVLDDDDEQNAKRKSLEAMSSVPPSSHKTVTEPKIIVQTRSEVDILNDGYKWRKYGQKVVKGNANPRSYYRCTYRGCNVRKHVERASSDPKSVVTTYEGTHNHSIPNSNNNNNNSIITNDSNQPLKQQLKEQIAA